MSERFRIAVIGTGQIAGLNATRDDKPPLVTHAQAFTHEGSFDLVALHDTDKERALTFSEHWGGKVYGELPTLLEDARPDVVLVTVPDESHFTVTQALLESRSRPCLTIVEKPPCLDRDELEQLLKSTNRAEDTTVIVNMTRRFDLGHRNVADLVSNRELGDPVEIIGTYYGGWLHNGIHMIDTLRMILGGDIKLESSTVGASGRRGDPCRDVVIHAEQWPEAQVSLRGFDEKVFQLFELDFRLTGGRIRLEDFGQRIVTERVVVNGIGERELQPTMLINQVASDPMLNLYQACSTYLKEGDVNEFSGVLIKDVARTMEVLFDGV